MSTFTDWNGPQGGNIRAMDLIQLANAYSDLVARLNQHTQETTATNNVHSSKDYVDSKINEIKQLIVPMSNFYTKDESDDKYALKEDVPVDYTTNAQVDNKIATALDDYLKKNELDSQAIIVAIQNDIEQLQQVIFSGGTFQVSNLEANGYVKGIIEAVEHVNFTDKRVVAEVGGSDLDGAYYILAMLLDKAGTAYVKYTDDHSFSAAVTFAVTPEWKGAMSVVTDSKLPAFKFKIVYGTSTDGEKHAYLAVFSSQWISTFGNSDGIGKFNNITFDVGGINIIPVGAEGYVKPNGGCNDVCDCKSIGPGLSFSSLSTVVLNKQIYRESQNPYLTYNDVKALDTIGNISFWPEYDEETAVAINVPNGYHACDGTPVLDTDDVSDEFRAKFTNYPLQDYAIIKTKAGIDLEPVENDRSSLAEAVCRLHGINFYYGTDTLPDVEDAKIDVPVIVQADVNRFIVYTPAEVDGVRKWVRWSTVYNDINKSIAAVAEVIANLHSIDVYTVYSSEEDLPVGPDVEDGSMAIVFDGAEYTIYKYLAGTWTRQ